MSNISSLDSGSNGFSAEARPDVFVQTCCVGGTGPKVAIKDVVDIAGLPTVAGSKALNSDIKAEKNAEIVSRLLDSGCRLIGKTTMHELAYGVTGINEWAGTPINTFYPELIPGGSSSGSAVAVSAHLCDFSIGTDTGGSVRVPAACCGIYGLKPTFGRLPRAGLTPAESSLDCVGPFARTAAGLGTAMRCLDPEFGPLPDISKVKLAWIETEAEYFVNQIARSAAEMLDREMDVRPLDLFAEAHVAGLAIIASETYAAFRHLLPSGQVGADVAERLKLAAKISTEELARAERVRTDFTQHLDDLFEQVDIVALPTLPDTPPKLDGARDLLKMVNITTLCRPFNLSGHPAIAIPVGEHDGKPVSLQLVAPMGEDEKLMALALAYEQAKKWQRVSGTRAGDLPG